MNKRRERGREGGEEGRRWKREDSNSQLPTL